MSSYLALKLEYINKTHTHIHKVERKTLYFKFIICVSRTVIQLIMWVNKPTVAYKLVQLCSIIIKTHTQKKTINNLKKDQLRHETNQWTLVIKPDTFLGTQEINFFTLYLNNYKKIRLKSLLKWSKKASCLFFFLTLRTMFYLPLSLFIFIFLLFHILLFPSSIFFFFRSLLHNFVIFTPHSCVPSFSTILIFSYLLLILDFPPLQLLI